MKKQLAILGSTGSIGTQTLEVVRMFPDHFCVEVLSAQDNFRLLIRQALEFMPNTVVIGNKDYYRLVSDQLFAKGIKVFTGEESLAQVTEMESVDMVVVALVGFSGLKPVISAINARKPIALANKECLVVAGEIITSLAQEKGVNIYPVDSEHSAVFQCLAGEFHNTAEKIILTASGGPFRGMTAEALKKVKPQQALQHPNWNMGSKITIDSATLMNKGLEVIEARWLFGLRPEQIEVIIHPQSIVHSMVQFSDGSIKAQMGLPDMKLPIAFALSYPHRLHTDFPRFSFLNYPELSFEPPDLQTFKCLSLAYKAIGKGGSMPCVLNAANEVAVAAFLGQKAGFTEIPQLIETCMEQSAFLSNPCLKDLLEINRQTRKLALELCGMHETDFLQKDC